MLIFGPSPDLFPDLRSLQALVCWFCCFGKVAGIMVEAKAGIAVGLNKGHLTTKKDKAVRPANRTGVSVCSVME